MWWKCDKGHSWQAQPANRSRGQGCPYCAGRYLIRGINDLQTVNPELAMEWDHEKNKGLTPEDVMPRSDRKVWWKCEKGHSFESSIGNRSQGKGCPYCAGHRVSAERNLLLVYPKLCEEWNYDRNRGNTPENFLPYSKQKVWWKCQKCGHEWEVMILSRTQSGSGCPNCARQEIRNRIWARPRKCTVLRKRAVAEEASLAHRLPELLKDWDYTKNGASPKEVAPFSKLSVWWKCHSCGHKWQSSVHKRSVGTKCPECAKKNPKQRTHSHPGHPVRQYALDGEFIKEYPSVKAAMAETGITGIALCCTHRNKTAGGFLWRYAEECEDDWKTRE